MTNREQHWGWIGKMRLQAGSAALALAVVLGLATQSAQAQTFTVVYSFKGSPDGEYPYSGLVRDAAGSFYGTTYLGGTSGYGTAFKVNKNGKETVLYRFTGSPDGHNPYKGLARDANGNLYGTTYEGGSFGFGTVFKLSKTGKETVLYSFTDAGGDGAYPVAALVRDGAGNLYGDTLGGGDPSCDDGCGTVFKVDKTGKETVLHSFAGSDGSYPNTGLVRDAKGNLYGTTYSGGSSRNCDEGCGVVFQLDPTGKETVLHSFAGSDGEYPVAGLIMDAKGNLYGDAYFGGTFGYGTVFKVSKSGKETVLYNFCPKSGCSDGAYPQAGLARDTAGNLYGTAFDGGSDNYGTVWKLNKKGVLAVLHTFVGSDGKHPFGRVIMGANGNLYGTAETGGSRGYGTVWKLTPQPR